MARRISSAAAGCCQRANCARKAERCSGVGLNRKRMRLFLAASTWVEPPRKVSRQPGGSVEGGDDLTRPPRVSFPVTAQGPLQASGEAFAGQFLRVNPPRQIMGGEGFGPDLLLNLVRSPGDNHQGSRRGEGFTHTIVTAHADDGIGCRHELKRIRPWRYATPGRGPGLQ